MKVRRWFELRILLRPSVAAVQFEVRLVRVPPLPVYLAASFFASGDLLRDEKGRAEVARQVWACRAAVRRMVQPFERRAKG